MPSNLLSDSVWGCLIDYSFVYTENLGNRGMKRYLHLMAVLFVSCGFAFGQDPSFQVIEGNFTWQEAKADAATRGGRLAVLNTCL